MTPIFKAFVFEGIHYAALCRRDGNVHIIDDCGRSYGAWMDVKSFKRRKPAEREPIGRVEEISARVL